MKRLTHRIIFYYVIFTLVPLSILGGLGFVFYYQSNLQSLNHQFAEIIESQSLNARHAVTELDTDAAQQVVNHIAHIDHVVKVSLNSNVFDMTLAEVVTTTKNLQVTHLSFPIYDMDANMVGSLDIEKNEEAIGKSELMSIIPIALILVGAFFLLGFLFSRQILALLSKPFYDAQRYGYLMSKGEIGITPPEHQYVEFTSLFSSIDNLRERLLDNINELKKSEQRLNTSYNLTQVCQFVVDTKNKTIVRANNEFQHHFGDTSQLAEKYSRELQSQLIMRIANNKIKDGQYYQVETLQGERSFQFNTTDSDDFIIECSALDVTSLITAKKELEMRLVTDSLTQIGNRVGFNHHIDRLSKTPDTEAYFIMIDLNGFKPINDTHGHSAGDFLLKTIAQRLNQHSTETRKVYRLGGDEFVIIVQENTERALIESLAQKIIDDINTSINYKAASLLVSASIGIARRESGNQNIEAVIHEADLAMYEAKETRSGWVINKKTKL
ncbi:GGDEF domain-containing protein [Vibrio atypicus]|uniref:GGDEF domain-containing protein n=1 Tax=Vibrio atypicus TaxID=558271 RepID=UPI00135BC7EC|nr:GGDEF domain-containing protein [Vibrio atypicus]